MIYAILAILASILIALLAKYPELRHEIGVDYTEEDE